MATPSTIGRLLRVDLTGQQLTQEELDDRTLREYMGGRGWGPSSSMKRCPRGCSGIARITALSWPLALSMVPGWLGGGVLLRGD